MISMVLVSCSGSNSDTQTEKVVVGNTEFYFHNRSWTGAEGQELNEVFLSSDENADDYRGAIYSAGSFGSITYSVENEVLTVFTPIQVAEFSVNLSTFRVQKIPMRDYLEMKDSLECFGYCL